MLVYKNLYHFRPLLCCNAYKITAKKSDYNLESPLHHCSRCCCSCCFPSAAKQVLCKFDQTLLPEQLTRNMFFVVVVVWFTFLDQPLWQVRCVAAGLPWVGGGGGCGLVRLTNQQQQQHQPGYDQLISVCKREDHRKPTTGRSRRAVCLSLCRVWYVWCVPFFSSFFFWLAV